MDAAAEDDHAARQGPFALDVIRGWPAPAHDAAYGVLLVHGAPDVADDEALRWEHLGPWKRVVVCATPDPDDPDGAGVVESVVDATVDGPHRGDVDAVAEEFRVTVEDDGELSVRGPDLSSNAVTLNVVHAVATGAITPDEARERRARDLAELQQGRPPDDADELHFAADAPHGEPRIRTPLGDGMPAAD